MLDDFKKFALRGNVIDLAVGIIIGAAFTSVVNSLVTDMIMPPVGLLIGRNINFDNYMLVLAQGEPPGPYLTLAAAEEAGAVTINYGLFINSLISFIIVAFAVFLLVRSITRMYVEKEEEEAAPKEPVDKECPYCYKQIPIEASRCPFCTSHLEAAKQPT